MILLFPSLASSFPTPVAVLLFWPRVPVLAGASRLEASFSLLLAREQRIFVKSCHHCQHCHCCYSLGRFHLKRMLNDRAIDWAIGSAVCPDFGFSCNKMAIFNYQNKNNFSKKTTAAWGSSKAISFSKWSSSNCLVHDGQQTTVTRAFGG